ncbi:unnamed protein product [Brassicogethes aeneus]|uniref:Uncharacterized protein n=1 Tax=Brassicogethes aeneus TaxID=1431903 RepID=A0A9P0BF44_BRAAE|nr:unnamed protein product [Brassicogethes aeneus]
MGNIGSQSGNISPKNVLEEQWAHSFPRTQPRLQQHKVLPERDSRQKLRHTNNGEILQSGGTISGRPNFNRSLSMIDSRHDEANSRRQDEYTSPSRMYKSNQRDPLHKSGNKYTNLQNRHQAQNTNHEKMKRFGSEPDLRYSTHVTPQGQEMQERSRAKKKYKAPAPPNPRKVEMEWDDHLRKQRLFKTQAETKNSHSSPVNKQLREVKLNDEIQADLRSNRLSLPETKMPSTVEFQEELKEATKRLRYSRQEDNSNKLKTLDPSIHDKEFRRKLREMQEDNLTRDEPSGKECSSEEKSPIPKPKEQPKTFYFGMDQPANQMEYQNDIIEHFTSKLHPNKKISTTSESDLSSEPEMDDCQISKAGIDLQLRPMLPKKQLEIPRFSPAAAWKLLSTIDTNDPATSTIASDDSPVFIEDRIEKYSRPPPPTVQLGPRSSNDKSGDSGISGDAPGGFEDSQENLLNARNGDFRPQDISWTPQQDLEDDSSLEEGVINSLENTREYQKKPHVFSLSLPRDNHLASYLVENNTQSTTHLQKLKRSVSGVLNNLSQTKKPSSINQDQNENWFLSKSAPNSLNNVPNSLELKTTQKEDVSQSLGRVMYLPDLDSNPERNRSRAKEDMRERSRSAERSRANNQLSVFSKSCENISKESNVRPENLQDPPKQSEWKNSRKPKKFTFQSTVRQIERKRLAEKLSREAERKEHQRLRELEAMQRVEEEFQKKRAREKANIRQQLRLYSLDEPWTSLPPNIELKDEIPVRQEPDGAVSSATSSPPLATKTPEYIKKKQKAKLRTSSESSEENKLKTPATQILSEFRQPQREYKEFRGNGRYLNELNENSRQTTTIHPQVIYNMPKAKGQNGKKVSSTNYRKDFAHGVKSNRSVGSSNSEESLSRNNSPRLYHNKYAPITRF